MGRIDCMGLARVGMLSRLSAVGREVALLEETGLVEGPCLQSALKLNLVGRWVDEQPLVRDKVIRHCSLC